MPEMTPVIFTRYHRQQRTFTQLDSASGMAAKLNMELADVLPEQNLDALFFMGRLGAGPAPRARSTRKSVDALMQHS
jgi:hypothetical protein